MLTGPPGAEGEVSSERSGCCPEDRLGGAGGRWGLGSASGMENGSVPELRRSTEETGRGDGA